VKLELPVTGITCAGCVRTITTALQGTEGVRAAEVNFATRRASVEFDETCVDREKIVRAIEAAGYGVAEEQRDEEPAFRRRLIVAAALTVPLGSIAMGFGMHGRGLDWLQLALCAPVVLWCGLPFFQAAWKRAKKRTADMNTLIAIGTGTAFFYSAAVTVFRLPYPVYFESAAIIVTFILAGRMLESRARNRASAAIRKLAELTPKTATVVRRGLEAELPIEFVKPGDIVIVKPGERIPVDGAVTEGSASINESALTGESVPAEKSVGSKVFAGTINTTRGFRFEAKAVARDTMLSQIVAMVERAQSGRAPIARLADEVSARFVPAVLLVALVTLGVWLAFGRLQEALLHFIAVLIVACPCALGLATPAAILVASGRAAQLGILFKGGEAIESAARVDTVIFDKTGTLTRGEPAVQRVEGHPETLAVAAAVERWSEHPFAKAIVAARPSPAESTAFEALPGVGARAVVAGSVAEVVTDDSRTDASWLVVRQDGETLGRIQVGDEIRPEAREAVAALEAMNLTVALLSGDRKAVAERTAAEARIREVIAPVMPDRKAAIVTRLQQDGRKVAMVGDGINDAPALASANVGIALSSGTDIAIEAAHITLVSTSGVPDLRKVPRTIGLARRTLATIKQNLFWAFAYNVVGIPLAAGALKPFTGWELSPMFAAAAMALSSVSVLTNSLRLRRA
jgi:Cu+-exporting ATPase